MADSYRVRINLDVLARNMSKAEGRTFSVDEARDFLASNCFIHLDGDRWLCEDVSLGLLHSSEIVAKGPEDRLSSWSG